MTTDPTPPSDDPFAGLGEAGERPPRRRRRRRLLFWLIPVVVILALAGAAFWVGSRALQAKDLLTGAQPVAHRIEAAALSGDTAAIQSDLADLTARAHKAASLTSDPVWRAAEIVPVVGANLTAVRKAAALVKDVADSAVTPLATTAATVNLHTLVPSKGGIDVAALAKASATLDSARVALDRAAASAATISTAGTLPEVKSAVGKLVTLVTTTSRTVDSLSTAARILPPMLGIDGPRNYLLLSLNNSQLRSAGGIPGAFAVITADKGRIILGPRSSAAALGKWSSPVVPLSAAEKTLFGDTVAERLQNVVTNPDFTRSSQIAATMWKQASGETVDGVISLDPVALGYILKATGPVKAAGGITLTSQNAATILLSKVYALIPDTAKQDVFFADATQRIFRAVTSGKAHPKALLTALQTAMEENRIHVWSAHADEQKTLATTPLVGTLPVSTATASAYGVYLNDGTGAKMDFYLRSAVTPSCPSAGRQVITVRLSSVAPKDAATSLPPYVTAHGYFGTPAGSIATMVYVYAPPGFTGRGITVNGRAVHPLAATHEGHAVLGFRVTLAPGAHNDLAFSFTAPAAAAAGITVTHTPMVVAATVRPVQGGCGS